MRKASLNSVFGLPTILTVLIVVSVLGFASLSWVSANAENKALKRSLTLVETDYQAESEALEYYSGLANSFDGIYTFLATGANQTNEIHNFMLAHPELTFTGNRFTYRHTVGSVTVTITAEISKLHQPKNFTLISAVLSISNDQDYTQDGDPIWKGPQ